MPDFKETRTFHIGLKSRGQKWDEVDTGLLEPSTQCKHDSCKDKFSTLPANGRWYRMRSRHTRRCFSCCSQCVWLGAPSQAPPPAHGVGVSGARSCTEHRLLFRGGRPGYDRHRPRGATGTPSQACCEQLRWYLTAVECVSQVAARGNTQFFLPTQY